MATIIPELSLNKTPYIAKPNSLIFAKNIRIEVDGSIHKDYGLKSILDNDPILTEYITNRKYYICGVIPGNNEFYVFIHNGLSNNAQIIRYDELEHKAYLCNTAWKYSGGIIDGNVIKNLVGDTLLIIGESEANVDVPIKTINLTYSKSTDDESIYTQAPNIPITNLEDGGVYQKTIPNGVYQFFVRYRIRENHYTNWFPASKELFVGNTNIMNTNYGTVKYTNINTDSDNSFIFNVKHLNTEYTKSYKDFQIGFLLSHDDEIIARSWKTFDFGVDTIYFDYNVNDIKEINVNELLLVTYQLYNVKNVTAFKNKIYISNYKESDFNENLTSYANKIKVNIGTTTKFEGPNEPDSTPQFPDVSEIDTNNIYSFAKYEDIGNAKLITSLINGKEYKPVGEILQDAFYNSVAFAIQQDGIAWNYDADYNGEGTNNGFYFKSHGVVSGIVAFNSSVNQMSYRYKMPNTNEYVGEYKVMQPISKPSLHTLYTAVDTSNGDGATFELLDTAETAYKNKKFNSYKIKIYGAYINNQNKLLDTITITNKDDIRDALKTFFKNNVKYLKVDKVNNELKTSFYYKTSSTDNIISKVILESDLDYTINYNIYTGKYPIESKSNSNSNVITPATLTFNITDLNQLVKVEKPKPVKKEYDIVRYQTMIPYQKYNFYVHYVKANGETTNGFLVDSKEISYYNECNKIIYPIFDNISIPPGYNSCFFTISHINEKVASIFNIENSDQGYAKEGNCVELNLHLLPYNKKIKCKANSIETTAKYYYSANPENAKFFGADGVVYFDDTNYDKINDFVYLVDEFSNQDTKSEQLVKCTPYINTTKYDNYAQLNLLGFVCVYYPLNKYRCFNYYNDGSTVYKKDFTNSVIDNDNNIINLKELSKYSDGENKIKQFGITYSSPVMIYSSYNLNYLMLTEDPRTVIKTYYDYPSNDTSSQHNDSQTHNVIWKLFPSLTLAEVYSLPGMYKNYTKVLYQKYDPDNNYIVFDNTIRSSRLEGDESKVNIFKFMPNDYYNVPTDKGTITNLVAIGDSIVVHTKDSMYRFVGSNNLNATNGDIVTAESQPFDTGIREIFGSEYGFAGLRKKTDNMTCEQGYIFYDRDAKVIYNYGGNNQMNKLSDKINKLFSHSEVNTISFANDYYNNRFFVCITFSNGRSATLTYNFQEEVKSFVSLHDFKFEKSFSTKVNCYFINSNNNNIYTIDKNNFAIYKELAFTDTLYPQKEINNTQYYSVIDVIINPQVENIKTLDCVSWCARSIREQYPIITDQPETLLVAEEQVKYKPCSFMRIYTDTCSTELCDFSKKPDSTNISNEYRLNELESYRLPRYNQGVWTFNYFRNILNVNDNFKYLESSDNYRDGAKYNADQNSLIEGRYFIIRFVFDEDEFKLENVKCQLKNKIMS